MNKIKILVLSILVVTFFSCKNTSSDSHNSGKHEHTSNWSYSGDNAPEFWVDIDGYGDCGGNSQSPINIVNAESSEDLKPLFLEYSTSEKTEIVNNGHSIQVNYDKGILVVTDTAYYEGTEYNLAQFHFHCGSENTVDGKQYPMEIHLVHLTENKDIAVIALFVEEGEKNMFLEDILDNIPEKGIREIDSELDINNLLPQNKSYWTFSGSLTTPPCTEGVKWIVLKTPIQASAKQIEKMASLMPKDNFRPTQKLNDRKIFEF